MSRRLLLVLALGLGAPGGLMAQAAGTRDTRANSIGIEMVRIEPGSFTMGSTNEIPATMREDWPYLERGDWDETPAHRVTISRPYWISVTEVTLDQYRAFDPGFRGSEEFAPYVTGVSWEEARAFCAWLTRKEGKPYRLPTEAEWEYMARAGTDGLFWSGASPPEPGTPNPWGVRNVHSGPDEWVADWHGGYPRGDLVDPVGPAEGIARVVRGGGLDRRTPYFARSANRGGMPPGFPPAAAREAAAARALAARDSTPGNPGGPRKDVPEGFNETHAYQAFVRDVLGNQGNHPIGFRVVQAPPPGTAPWPVTAPWVRQAVRRTAERPDWGPDPAVPYFRKRRLLPIPPENTPVDRLEANRIAGFHPAILRHHHSPSLAVLPNGDVLAVYYTAVSELTPDVAVIAARLRFGAEEWDMPSLFVDLPDVDDHAPLLWQDGDSLRFFWGANKLDSGFPFHWMASGDDGATWGPVRFPVFTTKIGPHSAQPITSAFRGPDGTMYVASDAVGPESVLWVSHDGGRTWIDPGGRTGGRHTAFALRKDGCLLGMGGKSSDIGGFMPKSVSCDGGRTWTISKTPFPPLGSNQRPTLVRLASGRLFFAGDLQRKDGFQPPGFHRRGSYVALSEDEGETWRIKRLPGAEWHELASRREEMKGQTIGYSVARQGSDGVIHLITSMNDQALHFALNEAWILAPEEGGDEPPAMPVPTRIDSVERYEQRFDDGSLEATWSGGIADDGRWLLDGPETWRWPDGSKKWEATWRLGREVGIETFWRGDGTRAWTRDHRSDGSVVWTRYWPDGGKRTESTWRDMRATGTAIRWDPAGRVTGRVTFVDGVPVD